MNTEEQYEGQAHSLLATAFDDEVPVVNLVPAAVDGFRRHRRRTRVLGTAGGALALTGVIVAGTTVAFGRGAPAAQPSAASTSKAGGVDKCRVPGSVVQQAGWDGAMVRKVTENCETNIALIEQAIPGARVTPTSMDPNQLPRALGEKEPDAGPEGLRFYPVVAYDITLGGRTTTLSLMASSVSGRGARCGSFCMQDTTLSGGMPAQEYSGPDGSVQKVQVDDVLAFPSDTRALNVSVSYMPGEPRVFDFHAFSHSAGFAELVTGSVDLLLSPQYTGA